jgi:hypothetical protein
MTASNGRRDHTEQASLKRMAQLVLLRRYVTHRKYRPTRHQVERFASLTSVWTHLRRFAMHQDNFTDTLSSEDQPQRRSFGGLGRGPVALLITAGLLIGGGVGSFVAASATSAAPSVTTMSSQALAATHPCQNMGKTTAN